MIKKNPLLINTVMAIVFSFLAIACVFLLYIFVGWLSEISRKRYTERPQLSPAPVPYTDIDVIHRDVSGMCGGDYIGDSYTVNQSREEIEKYYQNEMEKHCLSRQGWQVTFSTMDHCLMSIYENGIEVNVIKGDCRYSACVLKDEAPSLHESFSVEIFRVSSTETFVRQNHGISYLSKPVLGLFSYLFSTDESYCGE